MATNMLQRPAGGGQAISIERETSHDRKLRVHSIRCEVCNTTLKGHASGGPRLAVHLRKSPECRNRIRRWLDERGEH